MLFHSDKPTELVWDEKAGRVACQFVSGQLETDDATLIGLLIGHGYRHEGATPEAVTDPEPVTNPAPAVAVIDEPRRGPGRPPKGR